MADAIEEFLEAMRTEGVCSIEPISERLASGGLVRFRAEGDKPGRRNGWACLHLDNVPAGAFGHYRLGIRTIWRAGSYLRPLSAHERQAIKARVETSEASRINEAQKRHEATLVLAANISPLAVLKTPTSGHFKNTHPKQQTRAG